MLTTNDEELWRKAWAFKDHGKSYAAVYEKQHPPGYRWLHESFGTNWRLTEMQSAIGRIQLTRMPTWTKLRNDNAEKIFQVCRQYPWLIVPRVPDNIVHAYYKCYVFVDKNKLPKGNSRDNIITTINEFNVPCYSGSCSEVYKEKAFDNTYLQPKVALKHAQLLGESSLMFLVHPTLTNIEMNNVCQALTQALDNIDNNT
jgi:dTDP-4-amino-4,6-dideoxygalactose transaminase